MSSDEDRINRQMKLIKIQERLERQPEPDYGTLRDRVEQAKRARREWKLAKKRAG